MKKLHIIGLALSLLAISTTSCDKNGMCENGQGNVVTRTVAVSGFSQIDFKEAGSVIIQEGTEQKVEIKAQSNIIDKIQTDVSGEKWEIEFGNGCYSDYDLTIYITIPNLTKAVLSGSGNIEIMDFSSENNLEVIISGSGDITLNQFAIAQNLKAVISGSGNIKAHNYVQEFSYLDVIISGSGNFEGFSLPVKECDVLISGSGNVETTVNDYANFKISGSGNISYKGSPQMNTSISGSGNVINAN